MPPIGRFAHCVMAFTAHLGLLNLRLSRHQWEVYDKQLRQVQKKYECYERVYRVSFADLMNELAQLRHQQARLTLLAFDANRAQELRARRLDVNERLLARLLAADVTCLTMVEEYELAAMVATCDFMQEQVLEHSQAIKQVLADVERHAQHGEFDQACNILAGLATYATQSVKNLRSLSV